MVLLALFCQMVRYGMVMVTNPRSRILLLFPLLTEMYCAGYGNLSCQGTKSTSQVGASTNSVRYKLAHLSDQHHCGKKIIFGITYFI